GGGGAAGQQRGVRGLDGYRPRCCGERRRTHRRVRVGQRGRARGGGVRGEPPRGDRPVRCPLRVPSQGAGGGGGLEQADGRRSRDLAGPRPRLSAPSECGLPGQPGKYFPPEIARIRFNFYASSPTPSLFAAAEGNLARKEL